MPRTTAHLSDDQLTPRQRASRRNGAKSKGPVTPEGKARSAQNARRGVKGYLPNGFRQHRHIILGDEDGAAYTRYMCGLHDDLRPKGALEDQLFRRVAHTAWQLERADRLEFGWFQRRLAEGSDAGLTLVRDCNTANVLGKIQRYRSGLERGFFKALSVLEAHIKERRQREEAAGITDDRPPLQEIILANLDAEGEEGGGA